MQTSILLNLNSATQQISPIKVTCLSHILRHIHHKTEDTRSLHITSSTTSSPAMVVMMSGDLALIDLTILMEVIAADTGRETVLDLDLKTGTAHAIAMPHAHVASPPSEIVSTRPRKVLVMEHLAQSLVDWLAVN